MLKFVSVEKVEHSATLDPRVHNGAIDPHVHNGEIDKSQWPSLCTLNFYDFTSVSHLSSLGIKIYQPQWKMTCV